MDLSTLPASVRKLFSGSQEQLALATHEAVVRAGQAPTPVDMLDNCQWYKGAASWTPWRAFLRAIAGEQMSEDELGIYRLATGRIEPPAGAVKEAWIACGRRARKTAIGATLGVHVGAYKDHRSYLAPGETAQIPMVAKNKADAKQLRDYIVAIFESSPALRPLLDGDPAVETINLKNRCSYQIKAANVMAGRSKSVPLAMFDEIAFWPTGTEAAAPDYEIVRGVRPGMSTVPGSMLVAMSSAYARRGELWEKYRQYFGKNGDILYWLATSLTMHNHPLVAAERERAFREDPAAAAAEYDSVFRPDVMAFVPVELVEACTDPGVTRREPERGVRYVAFVDVSAGTSDSFTLGIAHFDPERGAVLDRLEEWVPDKRKDGLPGFDYAEVMGECVQVLREFGINRVHGDKFAKMIPSGPFRVMGVQYIPSELTRSEIYRATLPLMTSGAVVLLDLPRLKAQLTALDRKVHSSGNETVDHPSGAHDDVANAACGAVEIANRLRHSIAQVAPEYKTTEEIVAAKMRSQQKQNAANRLLHPYARGRR